ncbi:MAG TPA: vWA domain-containing protein, partial [Thermoanaerobaculia bacterium]|nr:vWA domain-containing protein [Thermoanaerobaculia bacterium]
MKRALSVSAVCAALGLALATASAAADHVRVILDLSQSMRDNDRGKLAILSTLLLFDLARPNPTLDDSFEVIPFARDWRWEDPQAPPPTGTGPRIVARFDRRAELVARLDALRYDALKTYFYPGLLTAIEELEQTPGGAYDARTIVLVTDGVPEELTRDAELRRIEADLGPRLAKHGIRLYVLAFGDVADRNRDFFGRIVRAPDGGALGEYFVDARGHDLLGYMLQIFSGSFGYTADAAHPLPGTTRFDLDASTTPPRVAVVVLSPRHQPPPSLQLTPPAGGAKNAPEELSSASEPGGSYSLIWVLSPTPGDYVLASDAAPGSVALLRPTRLELEILPAPPHGQADRTIAQAPFPLRVRVKSPAGGLGDPGPVDLSYRTLGSRIANESGAADYAWTSDLAAPPPGPGTRTPAGRVYEIVPSWREDPDAPGHTYAGYLEIEARRGRAVVGSLVADHAHRVDVHPLLSIAPFPLSSYLAKSGSGGALGRRDQACTRFALAVDAGRLPHPETPSYSLRATLVPKDPRAADRELNQAVFTVDGQPLDLAGRPGTPPAPWSLGRALTAKQLLGEHELCLRVGKPRAADAARPLELAVAFT